MKMNPQSLSDRTTRPRHGDSPGPVQETELGDQPASGASNYEHSAGPFETKSPHRAAASILAGTSAAGIGSASLLWSFSLDGRWTTLAVSSAFFTLLMFAASGSFRVNMFDGGRMKVRSAGSAAAAGVIVGLLTITALGLTDPGSTAFAVLTVFLALGAIGGRIVGRWIIEALWRRGHLRASALVLGYDLVAQEMAVELDVTPSYGVDIVGYVTDQNHNTGGTVGRPVFVVNGSSKAELHRSLVTAVRSTEANRLIVGPCGSIDDRLAQSAARWGASNNIAIHAVPRFHQMGVGTDSLSPDRTRGYPLVRLQRSTHPLVSRRLKRLFDIALALIGIAGTAPLLLLATAAVRLSGPGPILFGQERVGQGGKPIKIYKFRSMRQGNGDTDWNPEDRITTIGTWLRRTNIDELPQLFSILKGDMSLVGPRPERPAFVDKFSQEIWDYDERHRMPVGLTGLAQVVGLRGDTSIDERVKYDNLYIDQWCLRADFEILAQTVTAVLFQRRKSARVDEVQQALAQTIHFPQRDDRQKVA